MNLSRRGFLSALVGSSAAVAAGVALPAEVAAAPAAVTTTPVPAGFNLAGLGDWIQIPAPGAAGNRPRKEPLYHLPTEAL